MQQGKGSSSPRIPRDLRESLGRVPASATDMEEVVLGALILQSNYEVSKGVTIIDKVATLLKPEYFYVTTHQEIYQAILALHSAHNPVDMRTVTKHLRSTGHLEMVGGPHYIAELTSKVSSAASIDYHAAIIAQEWLKREMSVIGAEINREGFSESSDAFALMEMALEKIAELKNSITSVSGPEKIKKLWEDRQITVKPEVPPTLVYLDQTPIVAKGDHTLVVGKKKSRKTLLICHFIDLYFKNSSKNPKKVLVFDTEQSRNHVWRMRDRIKTMTGQEIAFFYLRGMPPADRRSFISETIRYWDSPIDFIVIDGVRDLMSNINDPDESTQLICWIEDMTLRYNIGVINVLHLNKTDNNARGHIGTELTNKTIATIEVEYDSKTGYSMAKCESAREAPFNEFAFTHTADGDFSLMGSPTLVDQKITPQGRKERIEAVFADEPMQNYKDLIDNMRAEFAVSKNKAEILIREFIRNGMIIRSGKPRDPKTVYKLISSIGFQPHTNGQHKQEPPPPVFPEPDDLPF